MEFVPGWWAWATIHWFLAAWLMFIAMVCATHILTLPFRLLNRWIRRQNIAARGWPPAHLDADGDVIDTR